MNPEENDTQDTGAATETPQGPTTSTSLPADLEPGAQSEQAKTDTENAEQGLGTQTPPESEIGVTAHPGGEEGDANAQQNDGGQSDPFKPLPGTGADGNAGQNDAGDAGDDAAGGKDPFKPLPGTPGYQPSAKPRGEEADGVWVQGTWYPSVTTAAANLGIVEEALRARIATAEESFSSYHYGPKDKA